MPPVNLPGVSVVVSNVVAPYPPPPSYPYAPPAYPPPPQAIEPVRAQPIVARSQASIRRMQARFALVLLAIPVVFIVAFGGLRGFLMALPLLVVTPLILFRLLRAKQEDGPDPFLEQEILRVAAAHEGVVRVAVLAQASGRSLRDCQKAIDAMVSSGHATVDADDRGGLVYRVPDFSPAPRLGGGG